MPRPPAPMGSRTPPKPTPPSPRRSSTFSLSRPSCHFINWLYPCQLTSSIRPFRLQNSSRSLPTRGRQGKTRPMIGQNVGKYRIVDRIGRGGMGTVYRAHDDSLDRDVAIKVLNPELNDPEVVKRFRAEAVTGAKLDDPGIATIYELLPHEAQWLMVMEFVRGETLEKIVDRAGSFAPERAADVCTQVLTALGHAHRMGVVHRDLKPANLMMTESGAIKVMDFGIARVSGSDHLTHAGHMRGTPAYMAPEQVLGHEVDARADLYSMGVVLYRLVTGKLPFK